MKQLVLSLVKNNNYNDMKANNLGAIITLTLGAVSKFTLSDITSVLTIIVGLSTIVLNIKKFFDKNKN
jgi:hypothetical protein